MTTEAQTSLRVHIQELPARNVVCLTCQLDQVSGQFSTQIAEGFAQVSWRLLPSGATHAFCIALLAPR